MNSKGLFAVVGLLCVLAAPIVSAQTGEAQGGEQEAAEKKKTPFNLYVFAAFGDATADTINGSVETSIRVNTSSLFTLDSNDLGRAVVGWKRDDNRGDFRLIFTGYSETSYEYDAIGFAQDLPGVTAAEPIEWWNVGIRDGVLTTTLLTPQWSLFTDDANGDMQAQQNEVSYGTPAYSVSRQVPDNLQNRVQTFDFVYGRQWGKPPLWGARYFAGARYFTYDGTIPVAAFTSNAGTADVGFTDAFVNPLINFRQETTAYGPLGQLELHLNFAEGMFQIFGHLETAFVLVNQEISTGDFNTFVSALDGINSFTGSLSEDREKTSWQLGGEAGFRIFLPNGLEFEAVYYNIAYLDTVLLPPLLQVPSTVNQGAVSPPSAIYNTQDLQFDGIRAGIGFQF